MKPEETPSGPKKLEDYTNQELAMFIAETVSTVTAIDPALMDEPIESVLGPVQSTFEVQRGVAQHADDLEAVAGFKKKAREMTDHTIDIAQRTMHALAFLKLAPDKSISVADWIAEIQGRL